MTIKQQRESNVPEGLMAELSRPVNVSAAIPYSSEGQWVKISMDRLFAGGVNLYPDGVSIEVKPADIPLVRKFTGITEEVLQYNPTLIDEAYELVCSKYVRMKYTDGAGLVSYPSGMHIFNHHRLAMLLFIREVSGFKPWVYSHKKNDNIVSVEIKPETLEYKAIKPVMMKGFDYESGTFVKRLKDGKTVYANIPTFATAIALNKFLTEKRNRGEEFDSVFLILLPLLQRVNDMDEPETNIAEMYIRFQGMNADTISKYVQIAEWVNNEFTGNTVATVEGSQVKFPTLQHIKLNLMFSEEFNPEDIFED